MTTKQDITKAQIRAVMAKHQAGFSKKWGQHFLANAEIIEQIVESAELTETDLVIEIGPGIGVLTAACAPRAGKVTGVEIDEKLLPILAETLQAYDNVEILSGDILQTDVAALCQREKERDPSLQRVKIIGNLPYYITTPIILKLLQERVPAESLTVMMQREVAERLIAAPGSKAYGSITVLVQYYCTVEAVVEVPASDFVPAPKVDSTVLRMHFRQKPPVEVREEPVFFDVIRWGFRMRRKTLLNCMTGFQDRNKSEMQALLRQVGIEPTRRAETLTIQEFAAIANAMR